MYDVTNKVVAVTGGANGIGQNIVREFLKYGAKFVAILDVDESAGSALETELTKKYGKNKVQFIKCDVTNDDQFLGGLDSIKENIGYIDVLINNAAIGDESLNLYKKEIEINFTAVVSGTLKALEFMRKDRGGNGGTVINISSVGAIYLKSPTTFVYTSTKSAVLFFTQAIGMEGYYSRTNVRTITICFGVTKTNLLGKARSFDDEITDAMSDILSQYANVGSQTPEAAAMGVLEAYKNGESGSIWLVDNKTVDITSKVRKAYKIMSEDMFN